MRLARGIRGELLCGGRLAARLGPWQVSMREDRAIDGRWECEAVLVEANAFWLEHGDRFELRLAAGRFLWCWPRVDLVVSGGRVLITGEGRPEVKEEERG